MASTQTSKSSVFLVPQVVCLRLSVQKPVSPSLYSNSTQSQGESFLMRTVNGVVDHHWGILQRDDGQLAQRHSGKVLGSILALEK